MSVGRVPGYLDSGQQNSAWWDAREETHIVLTLVFSSILLEVPLQTSFLPDIIVPELSISHYFGFTVLYSQIYFGKASKHHYLAGLKKEGNFADDKDLHIPQVHWLYAAETKPRTYCGHTFLSVYILNATIFLFSILLTMAMVSLTCTQRYSKATGSLLKRSMGSFGTKLILKRHLILCELGRWVTQNSGIIISEQSNPVCARVCCLSPAPETHGNKENNSF